MATAHTTVPFERIHLDKNKVKRAQELFETASENEAVDRALDLAIEEMERNRIVAQAHREFLESGIEIRDVYGKLDR
jgi:hypothetical protein